MQIASAGRRSSIPYRAFQGQYPVRALRPSWTDTLALGIGLVNTKPGTCQHRQLHAAGDRVSEDQSHSVIGSLVGCLEPCWFARAKFQSKSKTQISGRWSGQFYIGHSQNAGHGEYRPGRGTKSSSLAAAPGLGKVGRLLAYSARCQASRLHEQVNLVFAPEGIEVTCNDITGLLGLLAIRS